jgi:hypothetical protein
MLMQVKVAFCNVFWLISPNDFINVIVKNKIINVSHTNRMKSV